MFFETKKVKLETLPEYLKGIRRDLKLSLEEVSKKSGVNQKALGLIEKGEYNLLPPDIYVKGFLAQLASVYGVDKNVLLTQYSIERQIQKNVSQSTGKREVFKKRFFEDWVITPKNLSLFGAAVFISGTIFYIVWQVFSIGRVPELEIFSPKDLTVVEVSSVEIRGKTEPGATVTVNNDAVFVDSAGNFFANLGISSGPKELVIVAKNRFNKTASKTLTIIGQSKSVEAERVSVELEMEFIQTVQIRYRIDGAEEVTENFAAGERKTISGRQQILLSVSNAGAVKVIVNGKNIGFLGRDGEALEVVPFSPESGNINSIKQ